MINVQLLTPNQNFGPTNSPPATGAALSEVQLPSNVSSLSSLGFGQYIWGGQDTVWNSHCGTAYFELAADSAVIPQPSISSLSPSNGVVGSQVNLTAVGVGLSAASDVIVTAQAGQPAAGIVAGVNAQDDSTADITIDLTDSSARPGAYGIAVRSYGVLTNALSFTVGDTTPIIDSIEQLTPLYPGGQDVIVITGSNFGGACSGTQPCPGADIIISCNNASNECTPTTVTHAINSWSDSAITAQLSAPLDASGFYDVQVTSVGAAGSGFQQPPGLPVTATSGPGKFAVTQPSNLKVVVKTNNGVTVGTGQCAYIDSTALQMPPITAKLQDQNG